jgi:hypothetical protein
MSCICPIGFNVLPDDSGCILIDSRFPSGSSSTVNALKSVTKKFYGMMGTVFYEDISDLNFPIIMSANTSVFTTQGGTPLSNTVCWVDGSGKVLDIQLGGPGRGENLISPYVGLPLNYFGPQIFPSLNNLTSVWGGSLTIGRLNYCGVWPSTTVPYNPVDQWIGFTACFNLASPETFYVGIGGEDFFRIKVNGQIVVQSNSSSSVAYSPVNYSVATWSVFPITLQTGDNYIELQGYNDNGTNALFGAEIYSGSFATISAATTLSQITAQTVFTTADYVGQPIPNVGSSGFTCDNGYVLDTCQSPVRCKKVTRVSCVNSTTTTTTASPSYLNPGYLEVNECDPLTLSPMSVTCNVQNVTGKEGYANGAITLVITGGTTPYTITWQYPNGIISQGPQTILNLSVGSYTATVKDYFGDFEITTTCTVKTNIPTPTTTTTTTIPSFDLYDMCMTILVRTVDNSIIETIQFNFVPDGYLNGYPKWISSPSGQESIYYNPSVPFNGGWTLSGSPSSIITTNNITVFNSEPSYPPLAGINPNFVPWTVIYPIKGSVTISVTEGLCF